MQLLLLKELIVAFLHENNVFFLGFNAWSVEILKKLLFFVRRNEHCYWFGN